MKNDRTKCTIRIAFIRIGGHPWTGGQNYLLNLLGILSRYARQEIQPVVFTGTDCPREEIEALSVFEGAQVVQTPRFTSGPHHLEMACSLLLGHDPTTAELFRQHAIDVVFEAAQYFGWRFQIPAIAWIPDFQHRYLPEMFSRLYRLKRNFGQWLQIRSGRSIMVSSKDTHRTCEQFYPNACKRIHTVSFSILPQTQPSLKKARKIARGYGLPKSFFYMPNQFWRHKNHLLVIRALEILRKRGCGVVVVASGQPLDPMAPGHFDALQKIVIESGLEKHFRIIGMIPRNHIFSLMRVCTALLNPSLFEGWSTTVEEARNLGTQMLLSDLPVHKEQMGRNAVYFDRLSAEDLANKLAKYMAFALGKRKKTIASAQAEANRRAVKYARQFVKLVRETALRSSR